MKRFYMILGVVAVVGAALLVYAASRPATRPATATPANLTGAALADTFRGYVSGSDSAPVEVVEYADFECPACATFAVLQMPAIREQLITTGRVRWRFRDFPLSMHQWARPAAHAAACAGEQGRFEAMHDLLFFRHREWAGARRSPRSTFRDYARQAGLEVGRWDDCMDADRYAARIAASEQEALRLGLPGTPSFLVNGRLVDIDNSDQLGRMVDSIARGAPPRSGR